MPDDTDRLGAELGDEASGLLQIGERPHVNALIGHGTTIRLPVQF
jgi:hypothetical protein